MSGETSKLAAGLFLPLTRYLEQRQAASRLACISKILCIVALNSLLVCGANAESTSLHRQSATLVSGRIASPKLSLPLNQESYCKSQVCKESIAAYRAMQHEAYQLIFDGDPVCKTIQSAINQSVMGSSVKVNPTAIFPKTEFNYVDVKKIYQSPIFLRWHTVPYWYYSPYLLDFQRYDTQPRPDAWIVVPYLNDRVPRLIMSAGIAYLSTNEITEDILPSQFPTAHWANPSSYDTIKELVFPPMGPCNRPDDPLNQVYGGPLPNAQSGSFNCKDYWSTAIHAPSTNKHFYRIISDSRHYDLIQAKNATDPIKWPIFHTIEPVEFIDVMETTYTLYGYTDFKNYIKYPSVWVDHPTTGVIMRVVKFSEKSYADLCLLAVGTGVRGTSIKYDFDVNREER